MTERNRRGALTRQSKMPGNELWSDTGTNSTFGLVPPDISRDGRTQLHNCSELVSEFVMRFYKKSEVSGEAYVGFTPHTSCLLLQYSAAQQVNSHLARDDEVPIRSVLVPYAVLYWHYTILLISSSPSSAPPL